MRGGEDRRREPRCWEYRLEGGWRIRAGRTDWDNEQLSLRVAGPGDWWFHIKGRPGSHVILDHPEGLEPDRGVLKIAAAVAAWHSRAREAGLVPVNCTRAANVSKPRGAPVGTVTIRRESTIKVRPGLPEPPSRRD